MALTEKLPKQINWNIWGAVAVAAMIILGGAGYYFDWFGSGATEAVAPAVEEAAPAGE
ncbi:hypothetical protein [Roseobacter denitrificans]|uniref:Uncharacterized protein n=1 Tax=Roseobacter denitrificans (strain ATCC 33942 / OCh 114) TaxID=375451 RepID=Q16C36_ROSDO|nr:hypothetical protein [Roseobacter denitrificans]ABG30457.1 hypothetical protein RD1_0776 [Roseobacter denitrificans OCh 114]SFF72980.1 hypothetical protein SAMN05443635_101477 [Roseobacter denitrificans OCh 114]